MSLLDEQKLNFAEAIAILPRGRGNAQVNPSTIWRWVMRGVIGPAGRRVRLEAHKFGNTWHTSREALERFSLAITPTPADDDAVPQIRTPTQRQRAIDKANRELEMAGI